MDLQRATFGYFYLSLLMRSPYLVQSKTGIAYYGSSKAYTVLVYPATTTTPPTTTTPMKRRPCLSTECILTFTPSEKSYTVVLLFMFRYFQVFKRRL